MDEKLEILFERYEQFLKNLYINAPYYDIFWNKYYGTKYYDIHNGYLKRTRYIDYYDYFKDLTSYHSTMDEYIYDSRIELEIKHPENVFCARRDFNNDYISVDTLDRILLSPVKQMGIIYTPFIFDIDGNEIRTTDTYSYKVQRKNDKVYYIINDRIQLINLFKSKYKDSKKITITSIIQDDKTKYKLSKLYNDLHFTQ